jgi:hypothetical protein
VSNPTPISNRSYFDIDAPQVISLSYIYIYIYIYIQSKQDIVSYPQSSQSNGGESILLLLFLFTDLHLSRYSCGILNSVFILAVSQYIAVR